MSASTASQLPPGLSISTLAERDLSGLPGRYAQVLAVELAPGVTEPRHTHGGDEFLYLLDGEGSVEIDGAWRLLPPDTALYVARGQVKAIRNTNASRPLRVLAFLVLDRNESGFTPV